MTVELFIVGTSCIAHFHGYKPNLQKCRICSNLYDKVYNGNCCYKCLYRGYNYRLAFDNNIDVRSIEMSLIKLKLGDDLTLIKKYTPRLNSDMNTSLYNNNELKRQESSKPIVLRPKVKITDSVTEYIDYNKIYKNKFQLGPMKDIDKLYNYCRPRCYAMDTRIFHKYDKKCYNPTPIQAYIFKRWLEYHKL